MKRWLIFCSLSLWLAAQPAAFSAPSFNSAVAAYKAGNYAQALQDFKFFKAKSPNNALTRYYLALCHQAMNHTSEAKAEYQWVSQYGDATLKSHAATGLSQLSSMKTGGYQSSGAAIATTSSSPAQQPPAASAGVTKVRKVLDFCADWCAPCRAFAPVFEATKSKFRNITFQSVNFDEERDLANQYGIKGIPHVVMLDGSGGVLYNGGAFGDVESFSEKINSLK